MIFHSYVSLPEGTRLDDPPMVSWWLRNKPGHTKPKEKLHARNKEHLQKQRQQKLLSSHSHNLPPPHQLCVRACIHPSKFDESSITAMLWSLNPTKKKAKKEISSPTYLPKTLLKAKDNSWDILW